MPRNVKKKPKTYHMVILQAEEKGSSRLIVKKNNAIKYKRKLSKRHYCPIYRKHLEYKEVAREKNLK